MVSPTSAQIMSKQKHQIRQQRAVNTVRLILNKTQIQVKLTRKNVRPLCKYCRPKVGTGKAFTLK
eukprot:14820139-Heterocapsa_arctica.AAC.1